MHLAHITRVVDLITIEPGVVVTLAVIDTTPTAPAVAPAGSPIGVQDRMRVFAVMALLAQVTVPATIVTRPHRGLAMGSCCELVLPPQRRAFTWRVPETPWRGSRLTGVARSPAYTPSPTANATRICPCS